MSSNSTLGRENVIDFNQDRTSPSIFPIPPNHSTSATVTHSPSSCSSEGSSPDSINLAHMDLLIHITQSSAMFNLGAGIESYHPSGLSLGLNQALAHPYLMHALLAFSAQHLAHLHPARSAHYLDLSVRLQTRGIELFNTAYDGVREDNCVAIVLFSSILGHHVLACTLAFRNQITTDIDCVIGQYLQCMDTHRGIHTIATSSWPALMASEIAPILAESQRFTSREPVGSECDVLRRRVADSRGMSGAEREACGKAIGYLQVGFDATKDVGGGREEGDGRGENGTNRHHMIYTWTMLVPREVTGLLVDKQPEALVLLAYYAVLLHRGRSLWQVGDAGRYLFETIAGYLGDEWEGVLEVPRRQFREDE